MSLGSLMMPGARGVLKRLIESVPNLTTSTDAMKHMQKAAKRKQLEEEKLPYLADQEDNPNWM